MGTKISKKRKIFNAFLVVILVFIVIALFIPRLHTGTIHHIMFANNGENNITLPLHSYEFYIRNFEQSKLTSILSDENKENLLVVIDADESYSLTKNIKCFFNPTSSSVPCKHYLYKQDGKFKKVDFSEFVKLSEQNITQVIIKEKSRRFQDF
ncbi:MULTISPECIES: hypothetical protein [unclassified Campylobacter]|uniref:hypothetical protein n=1 Tax=unclassified Campylobacter TaxID=2593542 RepID=UPI0022EA0721|nr:MULTISPECIES: hypothetical protein [unclassified Campylobacter]MDA3055971.1 hypothetical protein [Campylobacter sp. CN_NA1]MDA3065116.1 hypothetical protein [Campylobacter sp. CN_NE4]MDA3067941.1 hypothetical protein [Campylobacter sp. CN_NE3]MDA3082570.1 hypothetical protein [Campylobacter sp. CN_EL2]MDA3083692.1 hypothetical protein [Campylobacter sp. CN_NE1]